MAKKAATRPNNARLFLLLYQAGSPTLRYLLEKKANQNGRSGTQAIRDFVCDHQKEVDIYNKANKKSKLNKQKLVEDLEKKPDSMDITSLCAVLLCFFEYIQPAPKERKRLTYEETKAVKEIRDLRNKIAHSGDTSKCPEGCDLAKCIHNFYLQFWTSIVRTIDVLRSGLDKRQQDLIDEGINNATVDIRISAESVQKLQDIEHELKEACMKLEAADVNSELSAVSNKLKNILEELTEGCELETKLRKEETLGIKLSIRAETVEDANNFASVILKVIKKVQEEGYNVKSSSDLEKAVGRLMQCIWAEHRVSAVDASEGSVLLNVDTISGIGILGLINFLHSSDAEDVLQDISEQFSKQYGKDITIAAELKEESVAAIVESLENPDTGHVETQDPTDIDKCNIHPGFRLTYYCNYHDELACDNCRGEGHKDCEEIKLINDMLPTMGAAVDDSLKSADELKKRLKNMAQKTNDTYKLLQAEEKYDEKYLDSLRKDLQEKLKKTKRQIDGKRLQRRIESNTYLNKQEEKLRVVEKEVNALERIKREEDDFKTFVQMQVLNTGIKNVRKDVEIIEKKSAVLAKVVKSKSVEPYKAAEDISELPAKIEHLLAQQTASTYKSLSLVSDVDLDGSWISGCVVLGDDSCVLCDRLKSQLIMLVRRGDSDDSIWQIECTLDVDTPPYNITKVNDNTVLVTLPEEKKYMKVEIDFVNKTFVRRSRYKTGNKCYGIASMDDVIYVSCRDEATRVGSIEVRQMDNGHLIRTLPCEFMSWPTDIQIRKIKKRTVIYICDLENNRVYDISPEGELLKTFTLEGGPSGLAVDDDGTILVCENTEHKIRAIYTDARDDVILDESDGLRNPTSISYQRSSGILVVGMPDKYKLYTVSI